ncbi:peptidoglycan-binding protein [Streptomyces sp. NPDC100445]|uniref:peptidoglycan-binding domain-containing protein n=1 Tax=Streptomyces sp. NPDC100445 TaxID=3366102 RepID=UPI003825B448
MPTSPEPERPPPPTVSEPIRVLRLRRFDALAELMREFRPDPVPYRPAGTAPGPHPPSAEEDTRELPPVPAAARAPGAPVRDAPGPGPRRTAVAVAVAAAALAGFGCALLLTGHPQAAAAPPATPPHTAAPPATASAPPAATAPDPDGPGTLRQGDSGPPVTALQRRLLRVPDVYRDGSADGSYDASLTEAVARFQLWYGVTGDERGVYGDDTRRALESRTGEGDG